MEWSETEFKGKLHIKHGYAFKGEYFVPDGKYMVLTPGNFNEEGGFRVRDGKEKFYSGEIPEGYILKKGALIVAMTEQGEGLLGSAAIIPESDIYLHNQRLGLVEVNRSLIDKKFLFFLLNTNLIRQQIRNSSSGTKVRHTSPERIYKVKVRLPDTKIQKKIAAILSAYDDLIENNKRRIALLEKMSEEIYREWFVRFRFPGYQNTEFEKGIPKGWVIRKLGDILELLYGKALKVEDRIQGNYPVYGSSGIVGYHDKYLVKDSSIIVGRKGNVGSMHWSDDAFFPIDTVYYVQSKISSYYLFYLLQSMNFLNNDAAVPGLNRNQAYSNTVLMPDQNLINKYSKIVESIFKQKLFIRKNNKVLEKTKNMLLPRLISGKLSVENLDIQFPPSMQEGVA